MFKLPDKQLTARLLTIVLFMILSAAGLCFSVYLFYVSYPLSVQSWLLAVGFTLLSVIAGSFNIYAAMWYYRSYQYDGYLKNIMSKLKPVTSYPTVAVLIPSYNEEPDMVERNIKSLFALNYPKDKLGFYLVDDSTDQKIKTALQNVAKRLNVSYVHRNERKGYKAGAINTIAKRLNEDYIAIFDADEHLTDQNFLMDLLPFFQDEKVSYVQTEKKYDKGTFFSDSVDLFDAFFFKFIQPARALNNTAIFGGSCGLIRKSAFLKIGGFPEFVIEDTFFSFESDMHGYKSLYYPHVYASGRPIFTFTELAKQQWRYNYGDTQFIKYFYDKKGNMNGKSPLSYMDYAMHGLGLNYISVVLILFTLISVGVVFSPVPFAHINLMHFFSQNSWAIDLELLGFTAFTLSLMAPVFLTKFYFNSWTKGLMVFLLNYALAFVRTKAAIATLINKNPGMNWNRLGIKNIKNGNLKYSLFNTKTEIAFASTMFVLAFFAFSQSNLSGGIWLTWYGLLYCLATFFLHKYG